MSTKKEALHKAHQDISDALENPNITTDNMLQVYAAHSSTTAPDLSYIDSYGVHRENPVKSRNLVEVINTLQVHIATYPENEKRLRSSIERTRELTDEGREYCLVNYDTYEVQDSSKEAVEQVLSTYKSDLTRQIDIAYGVNRTAPEVTKTQPDMSLN